MEKTLSAFCLLLLCAAAPAGAQLQVPLLTINRGDIIVTIEQGPVMWFLPNGTPRGFLVSLVPGTGEGLDFDPSGRLYVTRWCVDPFCGGLAGNTVEVFNALGVSGGAVGSGYDCSPHAIVFTADSSAYVAQSGCSGDILRFSPGMTQPAAFDVALENGGSWWLDIAPDRCTVFYTSVGPNVKRYDTCARVQLPDFNTAPLPGGVTHDVRVLPDGGVLVSSGAVVARLDASGTLVQTYSVPGEPALWAGLDVLADGTFWAVNYETSNVHRFDLASGAVRQSFTTGTPAHTAVAVRVRK
jgi:outer membrane protein assembly factor BamB